MVSEPLFTQGLNLMMYGMGIVAVFLTVLVILTTLMCRLLMRWFPEADKTATLDKQDDNDIDPHIVAVIQAAIDKHRTRR